MYGQAKRSLKETVGMALPAANVGMGKPSRKWRPAFFNNKESSIVSVEDNADSIAFDSFVDGVVVDVGISLSEVPLIIDVVGVIEFAMLFDCEVEGTVVVIVVATGVDVD